MTFRGHLVDREDFCDFLESEIAAGRNPSSQKEWAEFFDRYEKTGRCKKVFEQSDN